MEKRHLIAALLAATAIGSGVAHATFTNPRTPVDYFQGHTHDEKGQTIGAPQHSGGTDAYGCHNASRPYHCH